MIEIIGTVRLADSNIQPLTKDAAAGQPCVEVADASGYYVGQWVTLGSEDLKIQGGGSNKVRRAGGDCGRIAKIDGATITFELPLRKDYRVAAHARLGTQPSAFLVTQPGVRIRGTGVIDGNKAGQFDFAPGEMTPSKGRGEDTRAGCGISVDSLANPIAHIEIEGITIRDCILHNLSFSKSGTRVSPASIALAHVTKTSCCATANTARSPATNALTRSLKTASFSTQAIITACCGAMSASTTPASASV